MSETGKGGVGSITDLKALRTRILGKTKVSRPVTSADALMEMLQGGEFAEQVKLAVPAGVDFDVTRFLQSVVFAINEDERLMACEPRSVLGCALRCAEIGLMVGGVMQHAYIVPRARRDGRGGFMYEAELSVGYRGMIALAMRSGAIKSITSRVVTDREVEEGRFDLYFEGEKDVLIHRPVLTGDKGEPALVYCLVRFVDGTFHVEPMDKSEIEQIKEMAIQRWNGVDGESPWVTNEMDMWRKSPVRRAFKYLNVQVAGLERAVRLEEERERGQRQDLARLIEDVAGSDGEPEAGLQGEQKAHAAEVSAASAPVAPGGESPMPATAPQATASGGEEGGEAHGAAHGAGQHASGSAEADGMTQAGEVLAAIATRKPHVERPAKYRDPASGATWNGWGKTPRWLPKDKEGRGQFLIDAQQSTSGGAEPIGDTGPAAAEGDAGQNEQGGATGAVQEQGAKEPLPVETAGAVGAVTGINLGDEDSVEVVRGGDDEGESVESSPSSEGVAAAAGDGS